MVCLPEHKRNQSMDTASEVIKEEEQAWEEKEEEKEAQVMRRR